VALATWIWRAVRQFVAAAFGTRLARSSCVRYLRRPDFVWKRPKKRLLEADPVRRAAFEREYADVWAHLDPFFAGLRDRAAAVMARCRAALQAEAAAPGGK
jgi:hypothetical protein